MNILYFSICFGVSVLSRMSWNKLTSSRVILSCGRRLATAAASSAIHFNYQISWFTKFIKDLPIEFCGIIFFQFWINQSSESLTAYIIMIIASWIFQEREKCRNSSSFVYEYETHKNKILICKQKERELYRRRILELESSFRKPWMAMIIRSV